MSGKTQVERKKDEDDAPTRVFVALVSFACDDAPWLGPNADIEITHEDQFGTHDVPHAVTSTTLYMKRVGGDWEHRIASLVCTTTHEGYLGQYHVTVKWTPAGGSEEKRMSGDFDAGEGVNAPIVQPRPMAQPRMGALFMRSAILGEERAREEDTTPPWTSGIGDREKEQILANIVSHVFEGLQRGLGYLWARGDKPGCCTTDGRPLRDVDPNDLHVEEDLEECWAQHATEMILGASYGPMGPLMGAPQYTAGGATGQHAQDAWIFQQYVKGPSGPVHSLIFACQQLTTLGLLSRGHDTVAENPFDSHRQSMESSVVGNLPGKRVWVPQPKGGPGTVTAEKLTVWQEGGATDGGYSAKRGLDQNLLQPGTCFWADIHNKKGEITPHVGLTLRANKHEKKVQLLDTSAWIWDSDYVLGGARDSSFRQTLEVSGKDYTGVMVPPGGTDLRQAIARMRTSRPLGVVRMVIGEHGWVGNPKLLYWVSPWLPMAHREQRYSISRYMAALRGCPYSEVLDIRWQFYIPTSTSLSDAVAGMPDWWSADKSLKPLAEIRVEVTGGNQLPARGRGRSELPETPNDGVDVLQKHLASMTTEPSPKPGFPKFKALWQETLAAKNSAAQEYFQFRLTPPSA